MTKLISFEGIDGVGKTTVINTLKEQLEQDGKKVLVLQEPGTTVFGEEVRALIKKPTPRSPLADVLLFSAARADMVKNVLTPAMKVGYDYIFLDRYTDSTIAYQGYGNRNNLSLLEYLNRTVTNDITPDKTILLTLPLDVAQDRRRKRGETADRYEQAEFLERVAEGYETIANENPGRIVTIQNRKLEQTVEQIIEVITAPVEDKREILHSEHKEARTRIPNVRYRARIGRFGRDHDSSRPTMLLAQVTNVNTGNIVADHVWTDYTRELINLGTLVPGDVIEFTADVDTYERFNKYQGVMLKYGLTNIRDASVISHVAIPETEEDFAREDYSRFTIIVDDNLFYELFSKYFGYLCYISQTYFKTPETKEFYRKGNN